MINLIVYIFVCIIVYNLAGYAGLIAFIGLIIIDLVNNIDNNIKRLGDKVLEYDRKTK